MNSRRTNVKKNRPFLFTPRSSDYLMVETLSKSDDYSHSLFKVKKAPGLSIDNLTDALVPQRYKNIWFLKENDSHEESIKEVIALECLRLFIEGQPKARLVLGIDEVTDTGELLVNTKEVIGFQPLGFKSAMDYARFRQKLSSGQYYGLGKVLVISLLLNEIDLKDNNMGVDHQGQIIKIDCGCCFARLDPDFHDRQYDITTNDIRKLPYIEDYQPYNWFDLREYFNEGKRQVVRPISKLFPANFSMWPGFRNEVNAALLFVSVVPAILIAEVVERCLPEELLKNSENIMLVEECQEELLERRRQLINAAIQDSCFRRYLKSADAKSELEKYIKYLKSYYTTGKRGLEMDIYEKIMLDRFEKLQSNPDLFHSADAGEEMDVDSADESFQNGYSSKPALRR